MEQLPLVANFKDKEIVVDCPIPECHDWVSQKDLVNHIYQNHSTKSLDQVSFLSIFWDKSVVINKKIIQDLEDVDGLIFDLLECPIQGCGIRVERQEVVQHLSEEHSSIVEVDYPIYIKYIKQHCCKILCWI